MLFAALPLFTKPVLSLKQATELFKYGMALVYLYCLFPFWLLCCGDLFGVGFVLLFGLVWFFVFVCKISYIIFARTEVRLASRWFSRFSFSFLMIAFLLILRQLWITILDLSQMIENGPAVRPTCSFSTLRCHLSDAMELHMSKWFKRSLTQSVCPACVSV